MWTSLFWSDSPTFLIISSVIQKYSIKYLNILFTGKWNFITLRKETAGICFYVFQGQERMDRGMTSRTREHGQIQLLTTAFQRYQSINKNNPARERKCWLTLWLINLSHVKNHRKNAWFHFELFPRVLERIFFKYWEILIQTSWIYSIFGMAIFFTLKD